MLNFQAIGDTPSAQLARSRLHAVRGQLSMAEAQLATVHNMHANTIAMAESHKCAPRHRSRLDPPLPPPRLPAINVKL